MPTTTNYGWTTPADTDLVKDGASAIRTLGTAIDTTVFNNASAGIPKTIVDAKGDLIVATAADTVARLAVGGTNNQVLTVDSSTATGLKWAAAAGGAGNIVQIATGTLSGAEVSLTGLSSYTDLYLFVYSALNSTADGSFRVRINSNTTAANYKQFIQEFLVSSGTLGQIFSEDYTAINMARYNYESTNDNNGAYIGFHNCKNAGFTNFEGSNTFRRDNDTNVTGRVEGIFAVSEAVSSIQIFNTGGNFSSGTYILFGA